MKKIVTIGGGSGQPELLRYLKFFPYEITAIVTMMDNGGSSGALRKELGVLPPGDVRKCMIALAQESDALAQEWDVRDDAGHAVGNRAILDAVNTHGSWAAALSFLSEQYHVRGRVLPVTEDSTHLVATLENGETIVGEERIDVPQHDATSRIREIALTAPATITTDVAHAIQQAECIVLTMGDLYTSVIPNLLVSGMTEAITSSGAPVVYICNRTSKRGETHGFTTADYVRTLNRYLAPAAITHIIVDDGTVAIADTEMAIPFEECDEVISVSAHLADDAQPDFVSGKKAADALVRLCTTF